MSPSCVVQVLSAFDTVDVLQPMPAPVSNTAPVGDSVSQDGTVSSSGVAHETNASAADFELFGLSFSGEASATTAQPAAGPAAAAQRDTDLTDAIFQSLGIGSTAG